MNELGKILVIKNTQCYYDDGDVDKEEFNKLKEKIDKALKLVRLTKNGQKMRVGVIVKFVKIC